MNRLDSRRLFTALGVSLAMVSAIGLGSASLYAAQTAPRTAAQAAPDNRGPGRFDPAARREDQLDRRLAFLHERLRITAAQERIWDNFTAQIRAASAPPPRPAAGRAPDRGAPEGRMPDRREARPSVVERLQRREDMLTHQHDRLDRELAALKPFYAALSDEQKAIADRELFAPPRRMARSGPRGGQFQRFGQNFQGRFRDR